MKNTYNYNKTYEIFDSSETIQNKHAQYKIIDNNMCRLTLWQYYLPRAITVLEIVLLAMEIL